MKDPTPTDLRYRSAFACAFIRGRRPDAPDLNPEELIAWARAEGLELHKFKRNELPRVRRVLGLLRGLYPNDLVDIGSGRGTFLWPLLDAFPELPVCSVERDPVRIRDLSAVRDGGVSRLEVHKDDVESLGLPDDSADIVTVLEVLEHLEHPERAAGQLLRVARRQIIASVPSKEDDNPEHIQLLNQGRLEALFEDAGAQRVRVEHVPGHIIGLITP